MGKRTRAQDGPRDAAQVSPAFDPIRTAELIESCRAHAGTTAELASITSRSLHECYEYEESEPHLGLCCELVGQVLAQVQSALALLGIVIHDVEPRIHAEEVAQGCALQLRSLSRAMHVVRATISILERFQLDHPGDVLPALHDIERGIQFLIDGLRGVIRQ